MLRLISLSFKCKKPHYSSSYRPSYSSANVIISTDFPAYNHQITPSITSIPFIPLGSPPNCSNSITANGYQSFHRILGSNLCCNRFFSSGCSLNLIKVGAFNWCGYGVGRIRSLVGGLRSFSSESDRESMDYDVVIVGAGPAGLSAAIRLKQLCREKDVDLSVCVVEKGAEVGAHILSGNVFEPRALNELLPQWKEDEAPIDVPVCSDKFWLLTKNRAFFLPSPFDNKGNYVISLSQLVRWLGVKAEELGVEIYSGFAASEILYDANDKVIGIATNDMGIGKDGSKKDNFQRGVELKGGVL